MSLVVKGIYNVYIGDYTTQLYGDYNLINHLLGCGFNPRNLQRSDPRFTDPEKT